LAGARFESGTPRSLNGTMKKTAGARPHASGPSQRQLRVGEVIRHALADILQRGAIADPAFDGVVVTVPEVRMAPDLKSAMVYIMPLGGKRADEIVAAFERNKRFLRGEIARQVNLRFTPDLRFRLDESFDEGDRIEALLRSSDVKRDLAGGKG
jgi:ribosome-binding factor A